MRNISAPHRSQMTASAVFADVWAEEDTIVGCLSAAFGGAGM
jgi:hypothetical protein